ncbi:MAG TPA: hypothetical protein PKK92_01165, partial [Methanothrix sp.]|nr:hypothetical protein [Methanothrix sp.]
MDGRPEPSGLRELVGYACSLHLAGLRAAVLLALLSFSGFSMAAGPDGGGSSITVSEKSSASRPVLNLSGSSFGGFTKITVLWNPATGTATRESYLYGDSLRRESTMGVDG